MKFYDDDMDELFNKAGRDYPLKTEPKDWNAVRGALHPEDGSPIQKKNGWRRLLPLLLLLLIPVVYVFIDKDNAGGNSQITDNSQQEVKINKPAVTKEETANTNSNNERITNKESVATSEHTTNSEPVTKSDHLLKSDPLTKSDRLLKSDPLSKSDHVVNRDPITNNGQATKREIINSNKETVQSNKVNDRTNKISDREVTRLKGGLSGPPQAGSSDENEPALWNSFPSLNNGFNSLNGPSDAISLKAPWGSLNQSGQLSVPNSDKKPKNNIRKGAYVGLITAPDVSMIKGQAVKGIGYSAGAIVGYTFNSRWQVEGGMLWSRKKYYTDGKYFDKKGPGIPDYVNVLWLDGGCEMFEFPIVARYNFSQKKNTFFGSLGLTSYLMKKEDYNYSAIAGAAGYPYKGYKKYYRSGDHLFSNLQLSAGYNLSLSSKLNIRIEPYLKAPLKKIGIGKMPVTSTGLYFAITRDFR